MLIVKDSDHCGNLIAWEVFHPMFSPKGIPFYKILEGDTEDASDAAVVNYIVYNYG